MPIVVVHYIVHAVVDLGWEEAVQASGCPPVYPGSSSIASTHESTNPASSMMA
jgi:hypothetical protein